MLIWLMEAFGFKVDNSKTGFCGRHRAETSVIEKWWELRLLGLVGFDGWAFKFWWDLTAGPLRKLEI